MAKFVMVYLLPDGGEERFELVSSTSYRIGSKSDNDIVVPQKDVSRHHAVIRVHDGWFHVTDLKSKNGTFVNGNQTTAAEFRPGDMVSLSSARLLFVEEGSQVPTGSGRVDEDRGSGGVRVDGVPEETGQIRVQVSVDDIVGLLDVTSRALENRALADPLAWAVAKLGLAAALVVYRDAEGRVGVVSSAGDLGPLVGNGRILSEVTGGALRDAVGNTRIRHAFEVHEDLLVARARESHVLVLRYDGSPPAVVDVQAVLAAVNIILACDSVLSCPAVVDPSGVPESHDSGLHGCSDEVKEIRRAAAAAGSKKESARLIGEEGAGKRRLARFIHSVSETGGGRFVAVDLESIDGDALEPELFGDGDTIGRVSMARGGTLFLTGLDVVSEEIQGRLAKALEEARRDGEPVVLLTAVLPDGEGRIPHLQPLEKSCGTREIRIPPLRHRSEDVPLIASAILSKEVEHSGLPATTLSPEVATMLMQYEWPDNVSELRRQLIGAAIAAGGGQVQPHHFSSRVREGSGASVSDDELTLESFLGQPIFAARDRFEAWLIRQTLVECEGNQSLAARRLGMSRAGLFKKIRKLDIEA